MRNENAFEKKFVVLHRFCEKKQNKEKSLLLESHADIVENQ